MNVYIFDLDDVLFPTTQMVTNPEFRRRAESNDYESILQTREMYSRYVKPDVTTRLLLERIEGAKFLLTNGSRVHARAAISLLGIQDLFVGQQDATHNLPMKPHIEAYLSMKHTIEALAEQHGIKADGIRFVFFDDRPENLVEPHKLGWTTVWIRPAYYTTQPSLLEAQSTDYTFDCINSALMDPFAYHHVPKS